MKSQLNCLCKKIKTCDLKVEGDVAADPIWCNICGCNLDIEVIPITNELKEELMKWMVTYGEWIDWSEDKLIPNGAQLEEHHNRTGRELTIKVRKELGEEYTVIFSPAKTSKFLY